MSDLESVRQFFEGDQVVALSVGRLQFLSLFSVRFASLQSNNPAILRFCTSEILVEKEAPVMRLAIENIERADSRVGAGAARWRLEKVRYNAGSAAGPREESRYADPDGLQIVALLLLIGECSPAASAGLESRGHDYVISNRPFSDKRCNKGFDSLKDSYDRFKPFGVPLAVGRSRLFVADHRLEGEIIRWPTRPSKCPRRWRAN